MSQNSTSVPNSGVVSGVAMANAINQALDTLGSNYSGPADPGAIGAYRFWADTANGLLKIRNAANSAWVTIGTLASANLGLQPYDAATAKTNSPQSWSKGQRPYYTNSDAVSATGSFTYDGSAKGQICLITMTNAITVTFAAPTNIVEGQPYTFMLKAGDASARTFAWNSAFQNTPPTTGTAVNGKCDVLNFIGGASNTLIFNGGTAGA